MRIKIEYIESILLATLIICLGLITLSFFIRVSDYQIPKTILVAPQNHQEMVKLVKVANKVVKVIKPKVVHIKKEKPVPKPKTVTIPKKKPPKKVFKKIEKTELDDLASLFDNTSLKENEDVSFNDVVQTNVSKEEVKEFSIDNNEMTDVMREIGTKKTVKISAKVNSKLYTLKEAMIDKQIKQSINLLIFNMKNKIKKEIVAYGLNNVIITLNLTLDRGIIVNLSIDDKFSDLLEQGLRNMLIGLSATEPYTGKIKHDLVIA